MPPIYVESWQLGDQRLMHRAQRIRQALSEKFVQSRLTIFESAKELMRFRQCLNSFFSFDIFSLSEGFQYS